MSQSLSPRPRSYWAMRTDSENRALLLDELRQGRLRQGWGHHDDQDLRMLAKKRKTGEDFSARERIAWRNRAMLGARGGIQIGDVVLLPNLPSRGEFILVEVAGPYRFEPLKLSGDADVNRLRQDYGHILEVKKLDELRPIPFRDDLVHAELRSSLTCRSRMWSLADYGPNIEELLVAPTTARAWDLKGSFSKLLDRALQDVYEPLEAKIDTLLQQSFSAAEFEVPCLLLLRSLFPGAEVAHTSGPSEHGADLVVTWEDPLADSSSSDDLSFRAVFQVKNWRGQAHDLHAIDQLVEAIRHYGGDYLVGGAYLLTLCDGEVPELRAKREAKSREMRTPIHFIGRKRMLNLMREYALAKVGK